jgi:hypothetical protein
LSQVKAGLHVLYVRAKDDNAHWGQTIAYPFVAKGKADQPQTNQVEYFSGPDLGYGNGTPIRFAAVDSLISSQNINLTGPKGTSSIAFRARNEGGEWGQTTTITIVKQSNESSSIVYAESFVNQDPGKGLANSIPLTAQPIISNLNDNFSAGGLPLGRHIYYVRAKDDAGNWSLTNMNGFQIVVGIDQFQSTDLVKLWPNPSAGAIQVAGNVDALNIYNQTGQLVKVVDKSLLDKVIDLSNLPKGIYLVKAQLDNQESRTYRLVLE